jgi:rhodanese-related sulfurtransferase
MMELANAAVPRITPAQAREMMSKGNTLVVDVRDAPEVEKSGKVAGAVQVSRGMLEFRADPEAPSHDKNFVKDKIVILYCSSGGRSALSGKVLKDMGLPIALPNVRFWGNSGRFRGQSGHHADPHYSPKGPSSRGTQLQVSMLAS